MSNKPKSLAEEILGLAESSRPWQRDLLRRVSTQVELSSKDLAEVQAIARHEHGLGGGEVGRPVPVTSAELSRAEPTRPRVVLRELRDVANANRLAKAQSLRFAIDGLTIVYGENGSGKSGYCRVLKSLCRVRKEAEEKILPDVFTPGAPQANPCATVRFDLDGKEQSVQWSAPKAPPAALSAVSVFDARAAPLYVNSESRIDVLPAGLDILPRYGAALQKLAELVDKEVTTLERSAANPLPSFDQSTSAGKFVSRLSAGSIQTGVPRESELRALATLSAEELAELARLESEARTDPTAIAGALRSAAEAAGTLAAHVDRLSQAVGTEAARHLADSLAAAREARQAAQLAAGSAFGNEALPGVGGGPWRLLFEQARAYSAVAYPGEPFPPASADHLCVLCQQPLSQAATERLQRFDSFLRGQTARDASNREQEVLALVATVRSAGAGDESARVQLLSGAGKEGVELGVAVTAFLQSAKARTAALLAGVERGSLVETGTPMSESPGPALQRRKVQWDARAVELERSATDAAERKQRTERLAELKARSQLAPILPTCVARIAELESLNRLRDFRKACDTTAVSKKATELRRLLVTREFEERLQAEMKHFGIEGLPVRTQDRSAGGQSLIGVALEATQKVKNTEVLSEGERTALALACFFAEVGGTPGHCGIVLDDPVSSLDQERRRLVAQRVVREAQSGRQVVVFTHDLSFLYELRAAAADCTPQVPVAQHELRKTAEAGCGTVFAETLPWVARPVKERLAQLDEKLKSIRALPNRNDDKYRAIVKDFGTDLREAWERFVEEVVLKGVAQRFQTQVKTQSLREVLVEDVDHRAINLGMTRASEWSGHDKAKGLGGGLPSPEELASEVTKLRAYQKELIARQIVALERRRKEERPPPATLG